MHVRQEGLRRADQAAFEAEEEVEFVRPLEPADGRVEVPGAGVGGAQGQGQPLAVLAHFLEEFFSLSKVVDCRVVKRRDGVRPIFGPATVESHGDFPVEAAEDGQLGAHVGGGGAAGAEVFEEAGHVGPAHEEAERAGNQVEGPVSEQVGGRGIDVPNDAGRRQGHVADKIQVEERHGSRDEVLLPQVHVV